MRIAMVTFSTSRSHINHICEEIEKNVYGAKNNKEVIHKEVVGGIVKRRNEVIYYPGRKIYSDNPIDNVCINIYEYTKNDVSICLTLDLDKGMNKEDWRFRVSRKIYNKVRDDMKAIFGVMREFDNDESKSIYRK